MNSDDLALVAMFTGPRGSGKTLVQTLDMSRRLIRSYLKTLAGEQGEQIFSNYPVGFTYYPGHGLPGVYLQPKPLNMEAFYTFDDALYQCHIYIDEIDQWLDRQEWMTNTQQILAKAVQLIRKRKMSITGTIQAFEWLNSKFQFQTDVVVKCRDAAFTPWGRTRHLQLGEATFTTWRDKSGVLTGYSFDESQKEVSATFQGKRIWNCYDTTFEFDPTVTSTRYKIKRPTKTLVATENGYVVEDAAAAGATSRGDPRTPSKEIRELHSEKKERIFACVAQAVDDFRTTEQFVVPASEMYTSINGLAGYEVDKTAIGSALKQLGIQRFGHNRDRFNLQPPVDLGDRHNKERAEDALAHLFDPTNHPGVQELVGAGRGD